MIKHFFSSGKLVLIIVLCCIALTLLGLHLYAKSVENTIDKCVSELLNKAGLTQLSINTKDRYKSPVLSGPATKNTHKKAIKLLENKCEIEQLNDLVNIIKDPNEKLAKIEFETDEFNKTISIKGQLTHQEEVTEILQLLKINYPDYIILENLVADETIESSDIVINLTLALSQIEEIELTEITLTNLSITLKGLVRDKETKKQVLQNFNDLFNTDLIIVDQLEEVLKRKIEEQIKLENDDLEIIKMDFNTIPPLLDPMDIDN
jgi:hypothetical protein